MGTIGTGFDRFIGQVLVNAEFSAVEQNDQEDLELTFANGAKITVHMVNYSGGSRMTFSLPPDEG